MIKERDNKLDILRFIAIMCIIFAHTSPPEVLFRIRNFDVVMMVLLMGVSFYLSYKNQNYFKYLFKRFKRLIIPTWIFLFIFFILFYIVSIVKGDEYYFTINTIINSYNLSGGIGYVWIMRVFFIMALISPGILIVSKKIKNDFTYFIGILILCILYMLLLKVSGDIVLSESIKKVLEDYIINGVGYGIVLAIGIRIKDMSKKNIINVMIISFGIFLILGVGNGFMSTQKFKYPPRMYYISYGVFVSMLLYLLLDIKFLYNCFKNKIVLFIARQSIWLYFWHLIPVFIIKLFKEQLQLITYNYFTKFIFIFSIALILNIIQIKVTDRYYKLRRK